MAARAMATAEKCREFTVRAREPSPRLWIPPIPFEQVRDNQVIEWAHTISFLPVSAMVRVASTG
jgi:hypothetical protein